MTIGLAGAFLGGLAALFSPCAAMLLPSFFAYAFAEDRRTLLARTGAFYVGLLITLVPLGLGIGALSAAMSAHRHLLAVVGGVALMVLGVLVALGLNLPVPGLRGTGGTGTIAVILMGAVYGLAGACTGPLLGAVLTMVAMGGSPLYGALLMALFGAGMVVPLLILAWVWHRVDVAGWLRPKPLKIGPLSTTLWAVVSGLLLVVLGALFLLTDATTSLGGILDAKQQSQLENWLRAVAAGISDVLMLVGFIVVAAVVIWLGERRRAKGRL